MDGSLVDLPGVLSGYQAHIAIKRTLAIRRMPSSRQNLYKPLLTGAVLRFDTRKRAHHSMTPSLHTATARLL